MRIRAVICMSLLAVVGVVSVGAGEWKVGANWGFTNGGDIGESEIAVGMHLAYVYTDETSTETMSLELGILAFSDLMTESDSGLTLDMDMDIGALTLLAGVGSSQVNQLRLKVVGGLGLYFGEAEIGSDASRMVAGYGIQGLTASSDLEIEIMDSIGFILGAGFEFALTERLELFVDYRYTFLTLEAWLTGTVRASYQGRSISETINEKVKGSYDHGIARVGLNLVF